MTMVFKNNERIFKFEGRMYNFSEIQRIAKERYNNNIPATTLKYRLQSRKNQEKSVKKLLKKRTKNNLPQNKIHYEYEGKIYTSLKQIKKLAKKKFNNKLSKKLLSNRLLNESMTFENAIKKPVQTNHKFKINYKNKEYTINELIKIADKKYNNKLNYNIIAQRIKAQKWSVKKTLKTPLIKNKYQYNGKYYSISELAKIAKKTFHNEISYNTLLQRIKRQNWSVEKTLREPLDKQYEKIRYNGKYYSISELIKIAKNKFHNDVSYNILLQRIKALKWPIEKALKTPKIYKNNYQAQYNGKYYSMNKLVEIAKKEFKNNISYNTLVQRINIFKWPIEKALKTPLNATRANYEYNGKYYSISELVEIANNKFNNNISQAALSFRINQSNWPIEKALKTPLLVNRINKKHEYNGKLYSMGELTKIANTKFKNDILQSALSFRINKSNWPIEQALKTPKNGNNNQRYNNPRYKKYKYNNKLYSMNELVEIANKKFNNNISYGALSFRINKSNWPIEKALKKSIQTRTK